MEKNSLLLGIVLGAITPVLGFVVVELVFNLLVDTGVMAEVNGYTATRRFRTMVLIAICCNIIPFNISKNKKWDDTLRGVVFPTLLYVVAWIVKFYDSLF